MAGVTGSPLFHSAQYGNSRLYILTIPDNFGDLYHLPSEVLTTIKEIVTKDLFVRVDGPSQVVIFAYDNDTFIVESFRDETVKVRLVLDEKVSSLQDLISGDELIESEKLLDWRGQPTGKKGIALALKPHSFHVFQARTSY